MKCKNCKYYYGNGTCTTGVFSDLDNDTVVKVELGCDYGSPDTYAKKSCNENINNEALDLPNNTNS